MLMLFFLYSSFPIVGTAYVLQYFKVVSLLYHSLYHSVFFCYYISVNCKDVVCTDISTSHCYELCTISLSRSDHFYLMTFKML